MLVVVLSLSLYLYLYLSLSLARSRSCVFVVPLVFTFDRSILYVRVPHCILRCCLYCYAVLSQQLQCTVGSIALPLVYQSAISSIACFPVVTYRLLYYIHAYDGRIQVCYYYYYLNQSFLLLKCVLVVTSLTILVLLFACAT